MSDVETDAASLTVSRSYVAAFAFLAWEILLTLGLEVAHIWSARFTSPTKIPFLILRWYGLFALLVVQASVTGIGFDSHFFRPPHCHVYFAFQAISLQIIIALQQYLMALRVFALYNRNRLLIKIVGTVFVVEQIAMAGSNVITIPRAQFQDDTCHSRGLPDTALGLGAAPLILDLIMLILTCVKAVRVWRTGSRVHLLSVLVRDGIWSFIAVFAVFMVNGALFHTVSAPMSSIAWAWQYAVCASAACRAVLQMHAEGGAPVRELMHSTETDLALTTFMIEPEHDEEQVRHRQPRRGPSESPPARIGL